MAVQDALTKYCQLQSISVEDQQFCYNIDTMMKELSRLIVLGATDERICKRVKATNPHFCSAKVSYATQESTVKIHSETGSVKKGVIFM